MLKILNFSEYWMLLWVEKFWHKTLVSSWLFGAFDNSNVTKIDDILTKIELDVVRLIFELAF